MMTHSRLPRRSPAWLVVSIAVLVAAVCAIGAIALTSNDEPAASSPVEATTQLTINELGYLAAVRQLEPRYAQATDQSLINDAVNTCGDLERGEPESDVAARVQRRFARPNVDDVSTELAADLLAIVREHFCPDA